MLITRGFGTGTGEGPGGFVYVPINDPTLTTNVLGYKVVSGKNKLPAFVSETNIIDSPKVNTGTISTNLDLNKLQPKITTNIPKF